MSAMPAEGGPVANQDKEKTVQLLIPGVLESVRQRFKILSAVAGPTMQVLEREALEIGLEALEARYSEQDN